MKEIFLEMLSMSMTAGYFALIVILVRLPLRKIPKLYSYVLWAVVAFRLICPFSIESAINLMPVNPSEIFWNIISLENVDNQALSGEAADSDQGASDKGAGETVYKAAVILWLAGIAALLGHALYSYLRLRRKLQTATWVRHNIYETDRIITPFVMGIFRPRIYIPVGMDNLDYVLRHEQVHIKRRDYLIKPLAFLCVSVHWFNPILWLSYYLMCKDMEMSCDESVLKDSSRDIRAYYSGALLVLSARQSGLLTPSSFGDSNTKVRIQNVLGYRKPAIWLSMAALIGVIGFLGSCVIDPVKTEFVQKNLAVYTDVTGPNKQDSAASDIPERGYFGSEDGGAGQSSDDGEEKPKAGFFFEFYFKLIFSLTHDATAETP